MEKHYAGGYHKSTASIVVCQNLKSWHGNVQNSLKLPEFIIKYLNLFIGGVLSFAFEKLSLNSFISQR
jgi:hypothetical protein